jgi:hypothetical protein
VALTVEHAVRFVHTNVPPRQIDDGSVRVVEGVGLWLSRVGIGLVLGLYIINRVLVPRRPPLLRQFFQCIIAHSRSWYGLVDVFLLFSMFQLQTTCTGVSMLAILN